MEPETTDPSKVSAKSPAKAALPKRAVPGSAAKPSRGDATSVTALRRGLSILDAFSDGQTGLGVNEIARKVDVHKSTVSRLCATLEAAGYLERDADTNRFSLGARLYQLAGAPHVDADLRRTARPVLQELVNTCGETASLAVVQGDDVVVIDVVDGVSFVRMRTEVGMRAHLSASAAAKAILAWMPEADRLKMVSDWPTVKLTPDTLTNVDDFLAQLEDIRERGYSTDMEELEVGLRCVGAPVRDRTGAVVAAISVSGPRHRMTPEVVPILGRLAQQSAAKISLRLGAPPLG